MRQKPLEINFFTRSQVSWTKKCIQKADSVSYVTTDKIQEIMDKAVLETKKSHKTQDEVI